MVMMGFVIPKSILAVTFDDLSSKNAILYLVDEDKILFEKNPNQEVPIASLTKIMTAIIALEKIESLDEKVKITEQDLQGLVEKDASVAGFVVDEEVTYRDLLYGLLLPSGADAAQALTRLVSGSQEKFVELMNKKVEELQLEHTHFTNETGLEDEDNYSTVKELLTIFKYALNIPEFKEIVLTKSYVTSDQKLTLNSTVQKYQEKFSLDVPYISGGKTGFTDEAGYCLASFASKDDLTYILVTTGAETKEQKPTHFYDAKEIYEYYMNNYSMKNLINKDQELAKISVIDAKEKEIAITAPNEIRKYVENDYDEKDLDIDCDLVEEISYFTAPHSKLGTITINYLGEPLETIDVTLESELHFSIINFAIHYWYIEAVIIFMLLVIVIKRK